MSSSNDILERRKRLLAILDEEARACATLKHHGSLSKSHIVLGAQPFVTSVDNFKIPAKSNYLRRNTEESDEYVFDSGLKIIRTRGAGEKININTITYRDITAVFTSDHSIFTLDITYNVADKLNVIARCSQGESITYVVREFDQGKWTSKRLKEFEGDGFKCNEHIIIYGDMKIMPKTFTTALYPLVYHASHEGTKFVYGKSEVHMKSS